MDNNIHYEAEHVHVDGELGATLKTTLGPFYPDTPPTSQPPVPVLKRAVDLAQRHLPPRQPPRPDPQRDAHVEEVEHQRPAEDDGVEGPGALLGQRGGGDDDGPGEDPEEVGAEGLVEVPAGAGGEEDGG